ncbi:MAG: sigma-70 family RNA polymerase sigma factor [Saprospiraceae bacterium]|nr:sigma-70 family RNA polymerase sigma factor [Saprospiraceae bacterium]
MKSINDKELIELLMSGVASKNDLALAYLYKKNYRMVASYIQRNSGTAPDAEDVFQDSMIVLYNQVKRGSFRVESSLGTYLYGIAKNIWYKRLRKAGRETELTIEHESIVSEESHLKVLEQTDKSNLIAALLEELGEKCKEVLLLYYFEKLRLRDIADRMNWGSEQVAKNNKARCMKKMRELVGNHPNLKVDLR